MAAPRAARERGGGRAPAWIPQHAAAGASASLPVANCFLAQCSMPRAAAAAALVAAAAADVIISRAATAAAALGHIGCYSTAFAHRRRRRRRRRHCQRPRKRQYLTAAGPHGSMSKSPSWFITRTSCGPSASNSQARRVWPPRRCSGVWRGHAQRQLPRCATHMPILQDRLIIVGVVVVLDTREPEDPRVVQPPGQGRRATPRPRWCTLPTCGRPCFCGARGSSTNRTGSSTGGAAGI